MEKCVYIKNVAYKKLQDFSLYLQEVEIIAQKLNALVLLFNSYIHTHIYTYLLKTDCSSMK